MTVHKLLTGLSSYLGMSSTSCLICKDDLKIIIDTGAKDRQALLLKNIEKRNIKPEEIDIVLNTHIHLDHCWNNHLFPYATYYCSEKEYRMLLEIVELINSNNAKIDEIIKYYLFLMPNETPEFLKKLVIDFLYKDKIFEKMLETSRISESLLDKEGIQIVKTPGHTGGHVSFIYEDEEEDQKYVFLGDSIINGDHFGRKQRILFTKDINQYYMSKDKIEQQEGVFIPGHGQQFRIYRDSQIMYM